MPMRWLSSQSLRAGRATTWIVLVAATLLLVVVGAFLVYRQAHPDEPLSLQLWNFFESGTLKLVAGALVIPLLLFFVERTFNITETIRQHRVERATTAQDARREARLETLDQTAKMWHELYGLSTEVGQWDGTVSLTSLIVRLWNFPASMEDVVNAWRARFPNLNEEKDVEGLFLVFINTLLLSATYAAYHIRDSRDDDERSEVKRSLGMIQEGIDYAAHHAVLNILRASLELMEIVEATGADELTMAESEAEARAREASLRASIAETVGFLESWAHELQAFANKAEIFPSLSGPAVDAFRAYFGELQQWLLEDPTRKVGDHERFGEFWPLLTAIPPRERLLGWQVKYSREWLHELADWMLFQLMLGELEDRTRPAA